MAQPIRVLIVEDELNVVRPLSCALRLAGGAKYAIDVCACAEVALARLAEQPCDIVLTDLELPGMSGEDFLRQVRRISPRTRSILMTARGASNPGPSASLPAEGYLFKPFGLNDFLELVERLARDHRHDVDPP